MTVDKLNPIYVEFSNDSHEQLSEKVSNFCLGPLRKSQSYISCDVDELNKGQLKLKDCSVTKTESTAYRIFAFTLALPFTLLGILLCRLSKTHQSNCDKIEKIKEIAGRNIIPEPNPTTLFTPKQIKSPSPAPFTGVDPLTTVKLPQTPTKEIEQGKKEQVLQVLHVEKDDQKVLDEKLKDNPLINIIKFPAYRLDNEDGLKLLKHLLNTHAKDRQIEMEYDWDRSLITDTLLNGFSDEEMLAYFNLSATEKWSRGVISAMAEKIAYGKSNTTGSRHLVNLLNHMSAEKLKLSLTTILSSYDYDKLALAEAVTQLPVEKLREYGSNVTSESDWKSLKRLMEYFEDNTKYSNDYIAEMVKGILASISSENYSALQQVLAMPRVEAVTFMLSLKGGDSKKVEGMVKAFSALSPNKAQLVPILSEDNFKQEAFSHISALLKSASLKEKAEIFENLPVKEGTIPFFNHLKVTDPTQAKEFLTSALSEDTYSVERRKRFGYILGGLRPTEEMDEYMTIFLKQPHFFLRELYQSNLAEDQLETYASHILRDPSTQEEVWQTKLIPLIDTLKTSDDQRKLSARSKQEAILAAGMSTLPSTDFGPKVLLQLTDISDLEEFVLKEMKAGQFSGLVSYMAGVPDNLKFVTRLCRLGTVEQIKIMLEELKIDLPELLKKFKDNQYYLMQKTSNKIAHAGVLIAFSKNPEEVSKIGPLLSDEDDKATLTQFGSWVADNCAPENIQQVITGLNNINCIRGDTVRQALGYGFLSKVLKQGDPEKIKNALTVFWPVYRPNFYINEPGVLTYILPYIKTKQALEIAFETIPDAMPTVNKEEIIKLLVQGRSYNSGPTERNFSYERRYVIETPKQEAEDVFKAQKDEKLEIIKKLRPNLFVNI